MGGAVEAGRTLSAGEQVFIYPSMVSLIMKRGSVSDTYLHRKRGMKRTGEKEKEETLF